jgi:hypothetical protein
MSGKKVKRLRGKLQAAAAKRLAIEEPPLLEGLDTVTVNAKLSAKPRPDSEWLKQTFDKAHAHRQVAEHLARVIDPIEHPTWFDRADGLANRFVALEHLSVDNMLRVWWDDKEIPSCHTETLLIVINRTLWGRCTKQNLFETSMGISAEHKRTGVHHAITDISPWDLKRLLNP